MITSYTCASLFQFDYSGPVPGAVQEEVKEPLDNGPRPWNEPKIPMQEQKSQRQKIDEAIGTIKVCQIALYLCGKLTVVH